MKVTGIVCSPRRGGNTEILVRQALEAASKAGAMETALIHLGGLHIFPCTGCEACLATGACRQEDDMQNIYGALLHSEGIIIGTPVYFWSVTAQAKAFMDRTYCLIASHRAKLQGGELSGEMPREDLRGKVGGIITVAHRAGATPAVGQISDFYRIHRIVEAGAAIAYARKKGDVASDDQGMREARMVGKAVVRLVYRLKSEGTGIQ